MVEKGWKCIVFIRSLSPFYSQVSFSFTWIYRDYFYFSYGHFMSLQAEERSFEWNLEESRGVEGTAE